MSQQKEQAISVAFVDVISCGLGATVMLFLVFAVLEHRGSKQSDLRAGLDLDIPPVPAIQSPDDLKQRPALFLISFMPATQPDPDAPDLIQDPAPPTVDAKHRLARVTDAPDGRQRYTLMIDNATPGTGGEEVRLQIAQPGQLLIHPLAGAPSGPSTFSPTSPGGHELTYTPDKPASFTLNPS